MSFVFIMPLVVLYQIGIVQSGSTVRNLAEIWMTNPLSHLGVHVTTAINFLLLAGIILTLRRFRRTGPLSVIFALFMALESFIYAILLFGGVGVFAGLMDETVRQMLFIGEWAGKMGEFPRTQFLLGIGAGVYEEILFRVLMIGGGAFLLMKIFRCSRLFSLALTLAVSSVLFSAAHHVGSGGDPLSSYVFIFRALCGLALGLIFIFRGPGIAVMTHSVYNVIVLTITYFFASGGA